MGWWATGHGDDVMGDDVVDTLIDGFRLLEQKGRKPTFQEIIDAAADLVRSDGEEFLSDAESLGGRPIEAVFETSAPTLVSRPDPPADELRSTMAGVFREVAGLYLGTDYHRKPRLTELLEAMAFVLRVRPERFLREAEDLSLAGFRVKEK